MQPRLSVVVPIRNAEQCLTECLKSIAGQTLSCFEAVLVDDGSTDDSPRIAQDFAARDQRFRYVRRESAAGLSAARNTGVHESPRSVEFLAFADADDVVPHHAYDRLIASLDTTGSAFAAGNVWQLGRYGRRQGPAYRWLTEARPRTHITRDPRLLADRSARNKVFRRAFWDRHALAFPEGRRYESARVVIPAHFLAQSVDLLADHVSYQRVRQDASTLPPGADAKAVRDRIAACDHVSRFLAIQQPGHKTAYDASCLSGDLLPFLAALPAGGPAYREAFLADAADFVSRVDPAAFEGLPTGLRVKWCLVRERRLPELLELLTSGVQDGGGFAGAGLGTDFGGLPGFAGHGGCGEPDGQDAAGHGADSAFLVKGRFLKRAAFPGVRDEDGRTEGTGWPGGSGWATRLGRGALPVVARVREISWDAAGRLRVTGYAYVRNLAAARPLQSVKAGVLMSDPAPGGRGWERGRLPGADGGAGVLRGPLGMRRVRWLPTRSVCDPDATADSRQHLHCYDQAGFEITVDPVKLKVKGGWQAGDWLLGVLVGGHGTVRHAPVLAIEAAARQHVVRELCELVAACDADPGADGALVIDPGARRLRLAAGFDAQGRLRLSLVEHPVRIEGHRREGNDLVFSGRSYGAADRNGDGFQLPVALRLSRADAEGSSTGRTGTGIVIEAPLTGPTERDAPAEPGQAVPAAQPDTSTPPKPAPEPSAAPHQPTPETPAASTTTADEPSPPAPVLPPPAGDRFEIRVPLSQLADVPPPVHRAPREVPPPYTEPWRAELVMADGTLTPPPAVLTLPPGRYPLHDGRELCATADDQGRLTVELTRRPIADTVIWSADGTLTISGTLGGARDGGGEPGDDVTALLVLRHAELAEEVSFPLVRGPGTAFSAAFAPGGGTLREGRWYAYVRQVCPVPTDSAPAPDIPLHALAPLAAALPAHHTVEGREFTVDRRHGDRLFVAAGSVLAPADRGPYRRHRLRTEHYPRQRELPLHDAILYTAGRGDDSPRAVHEELVRRGTEVEHLWVTRDQQTHVPPLAHPVEEYSTAWYEALARCRRIVACDQLPDFFRRRPDQTVVQTWHGVPLKRIGADLKGTRYAHHARLEALPRLAAQWSVLVSPNRFAARHLCRALAYDGELLQAGSPRNDILFAADRDKTAERLKNRLGITEDQRVILYAPTYRDHDGLPAGAPPATVPSAGSSYHPAFDLCTAERALGTGSSPDVLLVRRHPLTTGPLPRAHVPLVRDVTHHPHTAELLLIADVLITDYSSLMFDFAHTGRPMLFHTPDLAHYRDPANRGFTFDFETRAPGPLLASTEEVLSSLGDLDAVTAQHADAYAAFREAYCDLDDGRAATRVADRLMR